MIKSLLAKVRKLFGTTTEEAVVIAAQVEQKVEELEVEVVKAPIQKLKKAKTEKKSRKPKSTKVV